MLLKASYTMLLFFWRKKTTENEISFKCPHLQSKDYQVEFLTPCLSFYGLHRLQFMPTERAQYNFLQTFQHQNFLIKLFSAHFTRKLHSMLWLWIFQFKTSILCEWKSYIFFSESFALCFIGFLHLICWKPFSFEIQFLILLFIKVALCKKF